MNDFTTVNMTPDSGNHCNRWCWFVLVGCLLALLGVITLAYQFIAVFISVYYIAVLLILAGIAQITQSFKVKGQGNTILWAVVGVLYLVTGIIALYNPIAVSSAITLIIAFLLIVSGIVQMIGAFHNRELPRWGWLLLSGVITLLLGLFILAGWPANSIWILATFIGIDLIFQGLAYVRIGLALRTRHIQ